jgi:hypothetical protein
MNILKQFENRKLQYFRKKEKLLTYLKFMSNKWCSLLWLMHWLYMLVHIEHFSFCWESDWIFVYWMWNFQMIQKSFVYIFSWRTGYICLYALILFLLSVILGCHLLNTVFSKDFLFFYFFFTFLTNIHDIGITVENNITIIKSLVLSKYGY